MPYNQTWLDQPYDQNQTDLIGVTSEPEATILDFSDFVARWQTAPMYEGAATLAPNASRTLALEEELPDAWTQFDQEQEPDLYAQFDQEVTTPIIQGDIDSQARQALQDLDIDVPPLQPQPTQERAPEQDAPDLDDFGR